MSSNTKPAASAVPARVGTGKIDSRDLFRGQPEVLIEHAGQAYRLRITRQGKLILTK